MKKYLIGFVSVVIVVFAVMIYINSSNKTLIIKKDQNDFVQVNNSKENDKESCCVIELKTSDHSENSIYNLESIWKDQNGNKVELKNFVGKKIILAMIYASCPTVCPVIVSNMKNLELAIPHNELNNYHFVLVSIDPDRDTPEKLNQYAVERNLDAKTWTLLSGSKNDVAELAEMIGFNYKKNANGTFTHSNLITFLDKHGMILNQSENLNQSSKNLLAMLNK